MEDLKTYINNILNSIEYGRIAQAAKNFNIQKLKKLLKSNLKGAQDSSLIQPKFLKSQKTSTTAQMIRTLLNILQKKLTTKDPETNFSDEKDNLLKFYSQIFNTLSRSEEYFVEKSPTTYQFTKIYYKIARECKKDLKIYLNQEVKHVKESFDVLINEMRNVFVEYRKSDCLEGLLRSLNQLFWVYFQMNQFQQCTHIMFNVKAQKDVMLKHGSKSQTVTLLFYLGRMNLFEGDYKQAETYLDMSFDRCHSQFEDHKIRILRFLIPIKILLGKMPSDALLAVYGPKMAEYAEMIGAVKSTDLKEFRNVQERYKRLWINLGLYFLFDKIELMMYRNLLKTYWAVKGGQPILDTHEITKAFNWRSGEEYSVDEVECVVGNLIFKGYARGYVFVEQKKVVLSKDNGFPKISNMNLK